MSNNQFIKEAKAHITEPDLPNEEVKRYVHEGYLYTACELLEKSQVEITALEKKLFECKEFIEGNQTHGNTFCEYCGKFVLLCSHGMGIDYKELYEQLKLELSSYKEAVKWIKKYGSISELKANLKKTIDALQESREGHAQIIRNSHDILAKKNSTYFMNKCDEVLSLITKGEKE